MGAWIGADLRRERVKRGSLLFVALLWKVEDPFIENTQRSRIFRDSGYAWILLDFRSQEACSYANNGGAWS